MLQLLRQQMQATAQQGGELAAAEARLEREAQEVLLLAGMHWVLSFAFWASWSLLGARLLCQLGFR